MQHSQQEISNLSNGHDMMEPPLPKYEDQTNGGKTTNGISSFYNPIDENQIEIKFADWGFKVDRLFEVAYRFYKRNESKAFHPSFDERNKMNALVMQARYGNHDGGKAPDVGVLDLIGKRRQYEWTLLNGMSKTEAMSKFICALDDLCPIFKAHAEAVKISFGIEHSLNVGDTMTPTEITSNIIRKSEMDSQMQNIYSSLCKQTYNQFKSYAEKQYSNDSVKQKYLITSLQEQYYQQYISQMHPEFKSSLPNSSQTSNQSGSISSTLSSPSTSDKFNCNNEPVADNRADGSIVVQANQLSLVPSASHLDLPLSGGGMSDPHEAETNTKAGIKLERVCDPIYKSDIHCEENDVQADTSSEELISGQVNLIDIPLSPVDEVDQSQSQSEVVKTDNYHADNSVQSIHIEPVKLYKHPEFPQIGVFESFPEPKPIKNISQKSTPIDQINPNLPPASVAVSQRVITSEAKNHSSGSDNLNEKFSHQGDITDCIVTDRKEAASQSNSSQCLAHEGKQESPPIDSSISLYEEGQTYFANDYQANQEAIIIKDPVTDDSCAESLTPTERLEQMALSECTTRQGPELWDCVSSNESHSPVQKIVYGDLEPATIWSKRGVSEFKVSLNDDKQGGIYEVKESTLIIIQVPTYPDGKYIHWEFATDDYDIGFGLEFVYEQHSTQSLALNIYEDLDEDEMDDMLEEGDWPSTTRPSGQYDPESGNVSSGPLIQTEARRTLLREKRQRAANTVPIVPTYRRDSHEEVFAGRHRYPGQGYYLLRFDNTYSVLRSKTVYFRICYLM